MIYDLHTHSTASDGQLSPLALIDRAHQCGVDVLAITDHDSVAAYAELPENLPLHLIHGIELSCHWNGLNVHIVGLGIDLNNKKLIETIELHRVARRQRVILTLERLERKLKVTIPQADVFDSYQGNSIGRPHIASYLLKQGLVKDVKQAFQLYLGAGKIGDIKTGWLALEDVVKVIIESGGVAVLAHPQKYKLTRTKLNRLLDDFMEAGGQSMEVISGNQSKDTTEYLYQLAYARKLLASCGSDFHSPENAWSELGKNLHFPKFLTPVWEDL